MVSIEGGPWFSGVSIDRALPRNGDDNRRLCFHQPACGERDKPAEHRHRPPPPGRERTQLAPLCWPRRINPGATLAPSSREPQKEASVGGIESHSRFGTCPLEPLSAVPTLRPPRRNGAGLMAVSQRWRSTTGSLLSLLVSTDAGRRVRT